MKDDSDLYFRVINRRKRAVVLLDLCCEWLLRPMWHRFMPNILTEKEPIRSPHIEYVRILQ